MVNPRNWFDSIRDARDQHRERHRPSGFSFATADRIRYLSADDWDAVTGDSSLFLSRRYRQLLEAHGPDGFLPGYALVYDGERPVAAVACHSIELNALQLRGGANSESAGVLEGVRDQGLQRLRGRVLVCGNLLSWGNHGVAVAPDVEAESVWTGVAEALYRLRRGTRLSGQTDYVVIKDVPEPDSEGLGPLRRFSYRPLETEPDMVLRIDPDWSSFDDYLGGLTAKYRKSSRRIIDAVDGAGCSLIRMDAADDERLYALYQQVEARAQVRLASLARGYLPALANCLGDDFRCTAIQRGDELLGFVTSIRDGKQAVGYYLGFDHEVNAEIPIYLRLLQVAVRDAIEFGCETLSLGRTALEAKARLGAQPVPTTVWIRHRVPVLNMAVRQLLKVVTHDEPPDRSPLKK